MTQEKLAKLAHVSVSTVSKAFAGSPEINEETKKLIFQIAKEHGCFDKYYKEKYNRYVIAVICPEFCSRYYADYLVALERDIHDRNATMIVGSTDFSLEKEQKLLEYYTTYAKVDGIIMITPLSKEIKKYSVPIVTIGKCTNTLCIQISYHKAVLDAVMLLKNKGHTRIGFIGEQLTEDKNRLFHEALKNLDMPVEEELIVVNHERFEKAGYVGMEALLKGNRVPTAVLCAYDYIAIGAMRCVKDHGLCVPTNVSLIGMDNIEEISYLDIPLTSIGIYKQELCSLAMDIMYRKLENPHFVVKQTTEVSAVLLERESVAPAPARKKEDAGS